MDRRLETAEQGGNRKISNCQEGEAVQGKMMRYFVEEKPNLDKLRAVIGAVGALLRDGFGQSDSNIESKGLNKSATSSNQSRFRPIISI